MKEENNPIEREISSHPEAYPFIAHYWKFHVESQESMTELPPIKYNYGRFTTMDYRANPFYKSISKLFDFKKIENELPNF